MTIAAATPVSPPPPAIPADRASGRKESWIRRLRPSRVVVNVGLGAIALFWLMPSLSMLVISFRPAGLFQISGWWKAFTTPS